MSHAEILKRNCIKLTELGYRGVEYGITGVKPDTARRCLCKLDVGVIHFDFAAFCEETKRKYDRNTNLVCIGEGVEWKDGVEGRSGWFYKKNNW